MLEVVDNWSVERFFMSERMGAGEAAASFSRNKESNEQEKIGVEALNPTRVEMHGAEVARQEAEMLNDTAAETNKQQEWNRLATNIFYIKDNEGARPSADVLDDMENQIRSAPSEVRFQIRGGGFVSAETLLTWVDKMRG